MSETMPVEGMTSLLGSATLLIALDVFGIAVGLISLFSIWNIRKTLGGRVGEALNLLVGGIVFTILALGWTILTLLSIVPHTTTDIHHLLMIVGLIFLVLAARSFAQIARP
jgi:hypothetical protein